MFTSKEIKGLLEADSILTKNLKLALQGMKEEFQSEWAKSLQDKKRELEKEIAALENKKEGLEDKSNEMEATFTAKKQVLENNINETEKKYAVIKENYDLLVESIKLQTSYTKPAAHNDMSLVPIEFNANGERFSVLDENEGCGFFGLLKENLELDFLPENLKEQLNRQSELFTSKACFIPSVSWAYLYAKAVRNSKLYIIHVEHDWLHYKNFLNNGLLEVLKSCDENKETNNILVFDALNLTQPECGLKPLLDVIAGHSIILPAYRKPFPDNLKVFATVVSFTGENKIGLPLDISSFANWKQICTPDVKDKIVLPKNFLDCNSNKGYFEPKDLLSEFTKNVETVNNGYFA